MMPCRQCGPAVSSCPLHSQSHLFAARELLFLSVSMEMSACLIGCSRLHRRFQCFANGPTIADVFKVNFIL